MKVERFVTGTVMEVDVALHVVDQGRLVMTGAVDHEGGDVVTGTDTGEDDALHDDKEGQPGNWQQLLEIQNTDAVARIVVGKMKGMMTSTMTMMKMRVDTDRPEAEAAAWVDQWPSSD